jgi:micrococcal nuclease
MGNCLTSALTAIEATSEALENVQDQRQDNQHQQEQTDATTSSHVGGASPIYSSLPPGAEKHHVRNVYDGDTLTLTDESRVRFLGIDTPEIKAKQPFAEEAKEYTKSRCDKRDVWLSFEGDRNDHYGRLLAFVFVEEEGGYLCMNEGIVAAGLASVYAPNVQSKTKNYDKMIALQTKARAEGKGMWSKFQNRTVFKTANGAAYHIRSCEHLANIRNLHEMTETEAMDKGLHACRTCLS